MIADVQQLDCFARLLETVQSKPARDVAARMQAALVRALIDQLRRHPSSDADAVLAQIQDEVLRLVRLIQGADALEAAGA